MNLAYKTSIYINYSIIVSIIQPDCCQPQLLAHVQQYNLIGLIINNNFMCFVNENFCRDSICIFSSTPNPITIGL